MQCAISNQINSHLSQESELEDAQEWKDSWVYEKTEKAFNEIQEEGSVWLGEWTVPMFGESRKKIYYSPVDFLDTEAATDILNGAIFLSLSSHEDLQVKMYELHEELKEGIKFHFEQEVDSKYEDMLEEAEQSKFDI